jgi:hypothetical protein
MLGSDASMMAHLGSVAVLHASHPRLPSPFPAQPRHPRHGRHSMHLSHGVLVRLGVVIPQRHLLLLPSNYDLPEHARPRYHHLPRARHGPLDTCLGMGHSILLGSRTLYSVQEGGRCHHGPKRHGRRTPQTHDFGLPHGAAPT